MDLVADAQRETALQQGMQDAVVASGDERIHGDIHFGRGVILHRGFDMQWPGLAREVWQCFAAADARCVTVTGAGL
jgi:hypothetical protein